MGLLHSSSLALMSLFNQRSHSYADATAILSPAPSAHLKTKTSILNSDLYKLWFTMSLLISIFLELWLTMQSLCFRITLLLKQSDLDAEHDGHQYHNIITKYQWVNRFNPQDRSQTTEASTHGHHVSELLAI